MNRPFTLNRSAATKTAGYAGEVDRSTAPQGDDVDSNSVRWVFAATVAFWLFVFAAGRSFF